jgi:hypothetical protein
MTDRRKPYLVVVDDLPDAPAPSKKMMRRMGEWLEAARREGPNVIIIWGRGPR